MKYLLFALGLASFLYFGNRKPLDRVHIHEIKADTIQVNMRPEIGDNLYFWQTVVIDSEQVKRKVYY